MSGAVTILIDGLTYASWLFIVALGLTLVFGVLKILNIAHGSFYALGAYAAASFVGWFGAMQLAPAWSIVALLLAAVAVAALVAPLTERGLLRFFYGRDEVLLVLVTYALFLILEDVTKLIWGANPFYVSAPYSLFGNVEIGTQVYVGYDFILVALALIIGVAVWWGLNRTRQGKIVLAVIHSPEIAASMGVNVSRVYMCGVCDRHLPRRDRRCVHRADDLGAARRVGGRDHRVVRGRHHRRAGQHPGAAIGALIVGLARSFAVHLWPVAELFSIYIVMAVVLMFRPEGLFQQHPGAQDLKARPRDDCHRCHQRRFATR